MNELIELAREKGFNTKIIKDPICDDLDGTYDYLWMCELQKWLMDEHNLLILSHFATRDYFYSIEFINKNDYKYLGSSHFFNTYEEALQSGLNEALKLLP